MFKIQHIPKNCNAIAYALIKIAFASGDTCVWKGSFPQIIYVFTKLI